MEEASAIGLLVSPGHLRGGDHVATMQETETVLDKEVAITGSKKFLSQFAEVRLFLIRPRTEIGGRDFVVATSTRDDSEALVSFFQQKRPNERIEDFDLRQGPAALDHVQRLMADKLTSLEKNQR